MINNGKKKSGLDDFQSPFLISHSAMFTTLPVSGILKSG